MKSIDKGSLVISLDFELLWGGLDQWTVDGYGKSHVAYVRDAIRRMISLFDAYGVHATFATVGFLMLDNADDIRNIWPKMVPSYKNTTLNPYGPVLDITEQHKSLFFAPEIVDLLKSKPNIEVGTHTFCHYYCWEEGQTVEQFEEDLVLARAVAEKKGISIESIVFPRNQVSRGYLSVCDRQGIKTYRGNARKFFDFTTSKWKEVFNKVSRLLDAYVNWGGSTTIPYDLIDCNERPINIPASRMLRPYLRKLSVLEPLRLSRIKGEMRHAAKHHELYHLWWHPHNFGKDMDENLAFLEKVLKCYQACHVQYGMRSLTMKELYDTLLESV